MDIELKVSMSWNDAYLGDVIIDGKPAFPVINGDGEGIVGMLVTPGGEYIAIDASNNLLYALVPMPVQNIDMLVERSIRGYNEEYARPKGSPIYGEDQDQRAVPD